MEVCKQRTEMNHMLRTQSRVLLARSSRTFGAFGPQQSLNLAPKISSVYVSRRFNSGKPEDLPNAFDASSQAITDAVSSASLDAAAQVAVAAPAKLNFVVESVMTLVDNVHVMADVPYWAAIVLTTIGLRTLLFPVALKTIQGSARMAAMRPDMQKVQEAMNNDPNGKESHMQVKYQNEMKALFVKHKVNPLRAMIWPFAQFPVFIAFFMALREMGTYYPGFSSGGAYWFENLAMADPLYIFPIINSVSFALMVELGGDGVQMEQQKTFKYIMRGLALVMIPITIDMPTVSE